MDQYQAGFTSQFEYLQQRIKRIEDRLESQHEDMMACLRSMFPPPPSQPWFIGVPHCFFFYVSNKMGDILGSRRLDIGDSYMHIIFVLLNIWCINWYTWHMIYDVPIYLITYIVSCFNLIFSLFVVAFFVYRIKCGLFLFFNLSVIT